MLALPTLVRSELPASSPQLMLYRVQTRFAIDAIQVERFAACWTRFPIELWKTRDCSYPYTSDRYTAAAPLANKHPSTFFVRSAAAMGFSRIADR